MKKFVLASAAAFTALVSVASAATKIEFKRDTGEVLNVTLNADGTAIAPDGTAGTYTFDPETKKMCLTAGDATRCLTYEVTYAEPKVGDSSRYTTEDGVQGTATVVEISE